MTEYAEEEILLYDLGDRPASFDFVTCMSSAIGLGMKHVRFVLGAWKKKNYTVAQAEQRWRSIVEPAVALFGLTYSIGEPKGIPVHHAFSTTMEVFKENGVIGKIPLVGQKRDYITITLRKSRNQERDSNEGEWMKFAQRCGRKAIIIRDYEERPLELDDRWKLYSGAAMNLMTINGPLTLCIHSDAPYISMRTIGGEDSGSTSPAHLAKIGITHGFQFPWANENQHLSYIDDTCENIELEFHSMMQRRKAA